MIRAWPWAALACFAPVALAVGCAALSSAAPSPADAYVALLRACDVYALLPADRHTHEADMACADVRDVCVPGWVDGDAAADSGAGGAP